MKIIFEKKRIMYILFFILFSIQSLACSDEVNYVQLGKYQSETLKIGYNYFYLDLSEFKNEDYLYFKVSLEYGYFRGNYRSLGFFLKYQILHLYLRKFIFVQKKKETYMRKIIIFFINIILEYQSQKIII